MICVAIGATVYAATSPSVASLNGTYLMQTQVAQMNSWSASKTCTYGTVTRTFTGGGQNLNTLVDYGDIKFDGHGSFSFLGTEIKAFNQQESDATVSITCPATANGNATIKNGHAVYNAPTAMSISGTYTVNTTGNGTLTMSGDTAPDMELILASFNSSEIAMTVLMHSNPATNNDITTGSAVHN